MRNRTNSAGRRVVPLLALALVVLAAQRSSAEVQRVEAMGNYGIRDSMRTRVIARDEAIALARWEGVSRVALELIGEAAPGDMVSTDEGSPTVGTASEFAAEEPSQDQLAALRAALGKDVLPYMRSYKILDDRGELPVFIKDNPGVAREYVVIVEVLVDVDRVTAALEAAGLIARTNSAESGEPIAVELLGLSRYEALEVLLVALREQFGATRVRTVEFSRDRQVLLVEGPFGPGALSAKLAQLESSQLILEPIGVDSEGRRIRLMGQWFPAPEEAKGASLKDES
jgi:hypothetical protein